MEFSGYFATFSINLENEKQTDRNWPPTWFKFDYFYHIIRVRVINVKYHHCNRVNVFFLFYILFFAFSSFAITLYIWYVRHITIGYMNKRDLCIKIGPMVVRYRKKKRKKKHRKNYNIVKCIKIPFIHTQKTTFVCAQCELFFI